MSQETGPVNHEGEATRLPTPLQDSSVAFPIPQVFSIVERAGFTPALAVNLRSLNDTLATIRPPEITGFNLELTPDALTPKIDFKQETHNPFKVELTGIADGSAALRISIHENLVGDNVLFSDIKTFVHNTFPGRQATFHTAPTIEFQGPVMMSSRRPIPQSLYEEERDEHWSEDIQRAREASAERYLKGVLPVIDASLDDVSDAQIEKLTERIEGADITITFYKRWRQNPKNRRVNRKEKMTVATWPQLYDFFEIKLDGQQESLLKFNVLSAYNGRTLCVFSELFYRGQPEEIEHVIGDFTGLLQKTPAYQRNKEDKNT